MPTVAELSVDINAKDDATATIEKLDALLRRLAEGQTEVVIDANAEQAQREVDDLQMALFDLDNNDITVPVDIPTDKPRAELEALQAQLEALTKNVQENIEIGVDSAAALSELAAIREAVQALVDNQETVNIDIDTGAMMAKIAEIEAMLKAIPDEKVTVEVDTDAAGARLRSFITTASRASTQVNALAMAIALLGPALVPLGATAVAAVGALGAAFGVAATGAMLFAGVAKTNFGGIVDTMKKMKTAQDAYNTAVTDKQKEAALAKMKALYDSLSPAEQAIVKGTQDLGKAWNAFAKSVQPQMFQMAGDGMKFIAEMLPRLTPLLQGVTSAFQELERRAISALNGPFWTNFIATMGRISGPVTTSLGAAFGNIIKGISGILLAFMPFATSVSGGFEQMTARFAEWGANLGNNPGFKAFIAYAQQNVPKVFSLLASLGRAFVAIVTSASGWGSVVLTAVKGVLDLITRLSQTNPNLLTLVIILTGLGLAIVNLAGPLLNTVLLFTKLGSAFAFLASPVGLIVGAIALLVAGFVLAYAKIEVFRNAVNGAASAVGSFVSGAASRLAALWPSILAGAQAVWQWLQSTFGPAVGAVASFVVAQFQKIADWWSSNGQSIIALAQQVWSEIQGGVQQMVVIIGAALAVLQGIWNAIWPGLQTIVQGVWTAISSIISGALNVILGIIGAFAALLTGNWSQLWENLKMILSGIWTAFEGILRGGMQILNGIIQAVGGVLLATWNAIWDGIKAAGSAAWDAIKGAASSAWDGIKGVITSAWEGIKSGSSSAASWIVDNVKAGWNTLQSASSTAWNAISSTVSSAWNSMKSNSTSMANSIVTTVVNGWNTIRNAAETAWNAIVNAVRTALSAVVSAITSGVSNMLSAWRSGWNSMVDAVKSVGSSIVSAVSGFVNNILSIITGLASRFYNAGVSLMRSFGDGIMSAANAVKDKVGGIISSVTSLLPGSPAEEGPLSGQGWTYVRGKHLAQDLAAGIGSEGALAVAATSRITMGLAEAMPTTGSSSINRGGGGGLTVLVAAGAVQVTAGPGADVGTLRQAFASSGDDLAAEVLRRIRRA